MPIGEGNGGHSAAISEDDARFDGQGLQFPYVQFPCGTLRGDQMFHILWKTVGRLERYGFKVMGMTCDGLAANRQLFRLHAPKGSMELVHKVAIYYHYMHFYNVYNDKCMNLY